jgi:hypothetical protein
MVLQTNLEQISTQIFPKIKPFADSFAIINYELSGASLLLVEYSLFVELDFAEREVNDPFVQQFITGVDSVLRPFKVTTHISV